MFDLTSFIRQNVPAHLRTVLNVGMINVLYAPIAWLVSFIEQTRRKLVYQARATGQVIVLEELCNVALYGTDLPGSIYLLDSNANSVDFQVVVPAGLSASSLSLLRGVLDSHKLAGKRYQFIEDASWTVPNPLPGENESALLTWEQGFPYLSDDGYFNFAIQQTGQFRVTFKEGETVLFDTLFAFVAGVPNKVSAASLTATYTIIIGNLTVSLVRQAGPGITIERVNHIRYNLDVFLGAQVSEGTVEMKLEGRDGTVRTDSYADAGAYGIAISGQSYNRSLVYNGIPDGKYLAYFRIKGQTAETTLELTFGNTTPVTPPPPTSQPDDDWVIDDPGDGSGGLQPIRDGNLNPTTPPVVNPNPTIDTEDRAGWQDQGITEEP